MINAARRIASERGGGNITLDAVAKEIGSTKGAVLHSFPSKAKLVEALLKDLCDDWDKRFRRHYDAVVRRPHAVLHAYLQTFSVMDPQAPSYFEAMLLALAEDPEMIRPVRDAYQNYARMIEEEAKDVDFARLVWMACEGTVMLELMGLHTFAPKDRSRLFELLSELASRDNRPSGFGE